MLSNCIPGLTTIDGVVHRLVNFGFNCREEKHGEKPKMKVCLFFSGSISAGENAKKIFI
jgi:hypothetical protein